MKQVLEYDHLAPATSGQLLDIFNDASDAKELKLELVAMTDGGSHFVTATYNLEGDGPLIFSCHERLASVSHSVAVDAYPNLEGVASRQANGNLALRNQLVTRTKQCISPVLCFFQRKFSQEFHDLVHAFKSARLCSPVQNLHANAASLAEL